MFKRYLISLLITLTHVLAIADYDPTKIKGLDDSSYPSASTSRVQVPYTQSTTVSGGTLLETGNGNFLVNPSFEHSTVTTGWTTTTGLTQDGSTVWDLKKSAFVNMSAVATGTVIASQSVTPTETLSGKNIEYSISMYASTLGSGDQNVKVCAMQGATEILCEQVNDKYVNRWGTFSVILPGPSSGSVGLKVVTTASATTLIYLDGAYVGKPRNLGQASSITNKSNSLTFTFTNWGTVSNNNLWWRRVGDQMIVEGTVTPGTTVASVWSLNLPSGYSIDTAKMSAVAQKVGYMERVGSTSNNFASSAFGPFPLFWDGSSSGSIFYTTSSGSSDFSKANGNSFSSGDKAFISFSIPILGWSSTASAVSMDQTDFGLTSFTPSSPNSSFGTITSPTCFYSRTNELMNISCTMTVGSMLNSEARISIPGGFLIKSTFTGLREVGNASVGNTGANTVKVLANAANNSYLTFGIGNASNASLSSALGTAIVSNNTAFSFTASIPIEGWLVSQTAPILVGGVSTSSSGNERVERATMTCASSGSTISNQSGAFSVSNGGGAGTCTASITSGFYAATPTCSCTLSGSSASGTTGLFGCSFSSMSSTSLAIERYRNGAFENGTVNVICVGPRL